MGTKAKHTGTNMSFLDSLFNPAQQTGVWATCPMLAILCEPNIAHVLEDEFYNQTSTKAAQTGLWVIIEDDGAGGTDGILDRKAGWYKHFCDGDDNDEAYLASVGESFKLETGKPLWFEVRLEWTNSATTAGAFIDGVMEGGGDADTIQDDEGGPPDDYDGFCFYKQSGETSVSFESSVATDQVENTSFVDYTSGSIMRLGAYYDGAGFVTPYIDGVAGTPHAIATGGNECNVCFGCKSNGAEEAVEIDWIKVVQIR